MTKEKCFIILTFILGMSTAQLNQEISAECTTPKSEKGVCIKIFDCPIMLNLLNQTNDLSNMAILKKSLCGFEDKKVKVCCPLEYKLPDTPIIMENVSKLPLKTMNGTSKPIEINAAKCTTPKAEKGICIKMQDCPVLLTLLNQTNDPSNIDFLKKSFCGHEDKKVIVCCPLVQPETTCGMRHISGVDKDIVGFRIFGGKPAKLGYWPWIVALGYQFTNPKLHNISMMWNCGGTLISSKHVLTAAHCVKDLRNVELTTVRLGELDLNDTIDDEASPLDVLIQSIMAHPKYTKHPSVINDIALLKLQESVSFTDLIQPICLPIESNLRDTVLTGQSVYVAGWGNTQATSSYHEPPNTVLMEVQVPVLSTEECNRVWSKSGAIINDKVLCAGFEEGGKDSCRGDSGGPLMWENGKQYFLMGIVSFGSKQCGTAGIPGVYTSVTSFTDWIFETKKII